MNLTSKSHPQHCKLVQWKVFVEEYQSGRSVKSETELPEAVDLVHQLVSRALCLVQAAQLLWVLHIKISQPTS
ncbi:UNVERIFIED_CONTAM: hypothetical protein Sradi_4663100 [Sesamum radiatum]|uniref:Uncharacterized protein n=1 Tax=Sesamum radiatum TaxID=300843 RepID=A0AAW2MVN2_SESRA